MKNFKTKASKLSNETLVMLAMRVLETVNQSSVDTAKNAIYFARLNAAIQRYMSTIGTSSEQQFSREITLLFDKRKQFFDGIFIYLKGLCLSPDTEMRLAAELLFEVVNRFGLGFKQQKISDQSLYYMRIIETLKKTDYVAALTKTMLTDKLTAIDNVQMEYETLYMSRGNSKTISKVANELCSEIGHELKLFYDELNWAITVNSTEEQISLRTNIETRMNEIYSLARKSNKVESPLNPPTGDLKTSIE